MVQAAGRRKRPQVPTQILAIMNQKGGVGKSTTAVNLAAALGLQGFQVLVVDFDPQGNTTSGFGINKDQLEASVYEAIFNNIHLDDVTVPTRTPRVFLVPATIQLAGAEVELVQVSEREQRLKQALTGATEAYDFVFIDCPPSLGILTVNAMVAARQLLIPIQCEFYALEGVSKLMESVKIMQTGLNVGLDIFGILLTMYDRRTSLSKQVSEEVRSFFGDRVFKTAIPRNVRLSEAPSYGESIFEYDRFSKGAQAYRDLAKEVIRRG